MAMFCKNCGKQLEDSAVFCPGCGTPTESGQQQAQGYAPPPMQQPQGYPQYIQDGSAPPPMQTRYQHVYQQPAPPPAQQYQQQYAPPPAQQYQQQYAPPPGQPVYQQPAQGYPPPKSNKKLILIIIIAAAVIAVVLLVLFAGGSKDKSGGYEPIQPFEPAEETPAIDEPEPNGLPAPESIHDMGFPMYSSPGFPTVFSFEAFKDMNLPRGTFTVNTLIDKYGPANDVQGFYLSGYEIIYVRVFFDDMIVYFFPIMGNNFSFYSDSLVDGESYPVEESDWNTELDVISVRLIKPGVHPPYGFEIGASTMDQIVDFYGESPAYEWEGFIQYNYYDLDKNGNLPEGVDVYGTGDVTYIFSEQGKLDAINVQWQYFDL